MQSLFEEKLTIKMWVREENNVDDISSLKDYLLNLGANFVYPDSSFINFTTPENYIIPLDKLDYFDQQNVLSIMLSNGDDKAYMNTYNYLKISKVNYIPCSSLHFIVVIIPKFSQM